MDFFTACTTCRFPGCTATALMTIFEAVEHFNKHQPVPDVYQYRCQCAQSFVTWYSAELHADHNRHQYADGTEAAIQVKCKVECFSSSRPMSLFRSLDHLDTVSLGSGIRHDPAERFRCNGCDKQFSNWAHLALHCSPAYRAVSVPTEAQKGEAKTCLKTALIMFKIPDRDDLYASA